MPLGREIRARLRPAVGEGVRPDLARLPPAAQLARIPAVALFVKVFVANSNKVLVGRTIPQLVSGPSNGVAAHYPHVYMAHLRRKIEHDPRSPRHLTTDPGVGYRFVVEEL